MIGTMENMNHTTRRNTAMYESLVSAAARGVSASKWWRQTVTAPATAAKWQSKPEFTTDVQEFRGKLLDRAIGKFTGAVNSMADAMIKLAGSALSEATRLSTQRAMMHNLIKITEFADLTRRIEVLEEKQRERDEEEKQKYNY
jgi:hypothetical protein